VINQYDIVTIVRDIDRKGFNGDPSVFRLPRNDDVAAVIEIWNKDSGDIEAECCDSNGVTIWTGSLMNGDYVFHSSPNDTANQSLKGRL
jgi:hypothetical protein